ERAMEPFFTTKPVGSGTGLGLSQVYGVARECGGTILIDSTPGHGTTVRLLLPPTDVTVPQARTTGSFKTRTADGTAAIEAQMRILVVDDDKHVRRFVAESLRGLGYAVTDVDNAHAALEHLRGERMPFDLLIADFAMPGMNGAELA